jgi:hypothetical protein
MLLRPSIPIRPPTSGFFLGLFQPIIGIQCEIIIQPMTSLIASRRTNDARNVAAGGKDKARIVPIRLD